MRTAMVFSVRAMGIRSVRIGAVVSMIVSIGALSSVPRTDRVVVLLVRIGGGAQTDKGRHLAATSGEKIGP